MSKDRRVLIVTKQRRELFLIYFGLALLMLAALACGSSTTQELADASATTKPTQVVGESAAEVVEEETESSDVDTTPIASDANATGVPEEPTIESTDVPEPTETPAISVEPVALVQQGFGQDSRSASYGFVVENPNASYGFEDIGYQIAALNAEGTIVDTDSGSITVLFPGQSVGVAGDLFVDEGVIIDAVEVQLSGGESQATEPLDNFTVENISYVVGDFATRVTGIVQSPFTRVFDDVRVSAILYGASDEIIGGGYTYVNFIPANSSTGVSVSVTVDGEVARAELYPIVSSLSLLTSESNVPADAELPQLTSQGFGQNEFQSSFGLLIENRSPGYAIENSKYRVTAFDSDGTVVAAEEGYVELLLPGQTLGIGGDLFTANDEVIDHVEGLFQAGMFVESAEIQAFTTENVVFLPGDFSSEITGQVNNPIASEITDLRVSALAFDEGGNIIGGGYTFLDFLPASGSAAVSVSSAVTGTPARVELYPTISGLSQIGQ